MKKFTVSFPIAVCFWLFAAGAFAEDAQKTMIDSGREEFLVRRCWFCHDVEADRAVLHKKMEEMAKEEGSELKEKEHFQQGEKKVGGDLSGVGAKYSKGWLEGFLQNPKEHFKSLNNEQKRAVQRMRRVSFTRSDKGLEETITYLMSFNTAKKENEKDDGTK